MSTIAFSPLAIDATFWPLSVTVADAAAYCSALTRVIATRALPSAIGDRASF